MWWKAIVAGIVVAAVSEIAGRLPRIGGLILTLPITSLIAFIAVWQKNRDMTAIASLARETLVLVPLGLPFFVVLAIAPKFGISFWPAFTLGVLVASTTIGLWFAFGPKPS